MLRKKPRYVVSVDLGSELFARVEKQWQRMQKGMPLGFKLSKSDVIRTLIDKGLHV